MYGCFRWPSAVIHSWTYRQIFARLMSCLIVSGWSSCKAERAVVNPCSRHPLGSKAQHAQSSEGAKQHEMIARMMEPLRKWERRTRGADGFERKKQEARGGEPQPASASVGNTCDGNECLPLIVSFRKVVVQKDYSQGTEAWRRQDNALQHMYTPDQNPILVYSAFETKYHSYHSTSQVSSNSRTSTPILKTSTQEETENTKI